MTDDLKFIPWIDEQVSIAFISLVIARKERSD